MRPTMGSGREGRHRTEQGASHSPVTPPGPLAGADADISRVQIPSPDHTERRERKALPGWAIDLIRDGVPWDELRVRGQRAVWDALGRTALAAINAGHSRAEWEYEVLHPTSALGGQNRLRDGRKARTQQAATKDLHSAWMRATRRATESPAWTREEARREAALRAEALRCFASDPEVPLTDNDRVLVRYAAELADRHGSVTVNLPRVPTAKNTGLGEKAVRLGLRRLDDAGVLPLVERGRARTSSSPGRANAHRLADDAALRLAHTYLSRETRQVGPVPQSGRPSSPPPTGPRPAVVDPNPAVGAHLTTPEPDDPSTADELTQPARGFTKADLQRGLKRQMKLWVETQVAIVRQDAGLK